MKAKAVVNTMRVDELRYSNNDFNMFCFNSLNRFGKGDWGDVCEADKIANDEALADGYFVLGVYKTPLCEEGALWIVADTADENGLRVVTLLFPSEY